MDDFPSKRMALELEGREVGGWAVKRTSEPANPHSSSRQIVRGRWLHSKSSTRS